MSTELRDMIRPVINSRRKQPSKNRVFLEEPQQSTAEHLCHKSVVKLVGVRGSFRLRIPEHGQRIVIRHKQPKFQAQRQRPHCAQAAEQTRLKCEHRVVTQQVDGPGGTLAKLVSGLFNESNKDFLKWERLLRNDWIVEWHRLLRI